MGGVWEGRIGGGVQEEREDVLGEEEGATAGGCLDRQHEYPSAPPKNTDDRSR